MADNMILTNGFIPAVGYDLSDAFAISNPANTATLTQIIAAKGVGTTNNTIIQRIVKDLSKTGASGGKSEGSAAVAAEKSNKTTIKNVAEIFMKTAEISGTALKMNQNAHSEELADRLAEIKEDINYNIINGVYAENDPRKMKGFKSFAKHSVALEGGVLTEEKLDEAIQKLVTKGNIHLAVAPANKLAVQRELIGDKAAINMTTKEVVAGLCINEYNSAQGYPVKIYAEPALAAGTYLLYDMDKAEYLEYRSLSVEPLSKTGDFESAQVVAEVTCLINPASAVVLN